MASGRSSRSSTSDPAPAGRWLLSLGFIVGFASNAAANDLSDRCQRNVTCRIHNERGVAHSEQKNYAEALYEFQAAYEAEPAPRLLLNIGRSLYRLDRPQDALEYYQRYRKDVVTLDVEAERIVRRYELEAATAVTALREEPEPRPAPLSAQANRLPPTASLALLGAGVGLLIIGAGLGGGAVRAGNELSQPAFNFSIFDPSQQAIEARGLNMQAAGIAFDVLGLLAISAGAASVGTWYFAKKTAAPLAARPRSRSFFVLGPSAFGSSPLAIGAR